MASNSLVTDYKKLVKLKIQKTNTDMNDLDKLHNYTFETEVTEKTNQNGFFQLNSLSYSIRRKNVQLKSNDELNVLKKQSLLYFKYFENCDQINNQYDQIKDSIFQQQKQFQQDVKF